MANKKQTLADAEQRQSEEWGIPNWKSSAGYPSNWEKLTPDEQRWEFLRRNEEYRDDWKRSINTIPSAAPQKEIQRRFCLLVTFDAKALAKKYSLSCAVPPQRNWKNLPKGFAFKREAVTGGMIVEPMSFSPEAEAKIPRSEWDKKLAEYARKQIRCLPLAWDDLTVRVEFDLSQSFDEQLKNAKKNLLNAQRMAKDFMKRLETANNKYGPDDYIPRDVGAKKPRALNKKTKNGDDDATYAVSLLRIYDARNCGRTYQEISGTLVKEEKALDASAVRKRHYVAMQIWRRL